jgi:ribonuclease P protein component
VKASKSQLQSLGRLQRRSDFLRIQAAERKWVSQSFILQAAENKMDIIRYGLTVSKKTDKSSVVRNRIKRRLRAVAAGILPLQAQSGMDYVLIGRPQTAIRDFQDLEKDLVWCLKRMELLRALPQKDV